jgi:hypothetical protein
MLFFKDVYLSLSLMTCPSHPSQTRPSLTMLNLLLLPLPECPNQAQSILQFVSFSFINKCILINLCSMPSFNNHVNIWCKKEHCYKNVLTTSRRGLTMRIQTHTQEHVLSISSITWRLDKAISPGCNMAWRQN